MAVHHRDVLAVLDHREETFAAEETVDPMHGQGADAAGE